MKKIEIIFIFLVIFVSLVVTGKYFIASQAGKQAVSSAKKAFMKTTNASVGSVTKTSVEYTLRKLNNRWYLFSGEQVVGGYEVLDHYGKVAIGISQNNLGLSFKIENVREYFTRGNLIITDIPYSEETDIKIYEQEDLFPIFGYHNVFDKPEDVKDANLDILSSKFEEQIELYNELLDCRWIHLSEIVEDYINLRVKIPRNTCVINFDDGRKNNIEVVFPILQKNNVYATFFIIAGRIGQKSYMNSWDINTLYRSGHEISSHALIGGSLVNNTWYKDGFTREILEYEVQESKAILDSYGFQADMLAYPLGEYNQDVIDVVKSSGYSGARATRKSPWREPRALSISTDEDFTWKLNYFKPEQESLGEIYKYVKYTGWWQFEEGFEVLKGENIRELSSLKPTENSYGVVSLEDAGDSIEYYFILQHSGLHTIDMLVAGSDFEVKVNEEPVGVIRDLSQECITEEELDYCHYIVSAEMKEAQNEMHITKTTSKGETLLDKFRISRTVPFSTSYKVSVYN